MLGSGQRAGRRRSNDGTSSSRSPPRLPFGPPCPLARIRLQVGELRLELIKQRATLRGLSEPLVPELPDRELELLDQQRAVLRLALRRRGSQFQPHSVPGAAR